MATNYTPQTWAVAVLNKLGYKATPGAVKALVGWQAAEGGHWNNSARYNPLNTTQPEPGYETFRSVGQGAADIGIYKSWQQGIDATVKTLENGRYGGILAGLRSGDAGAVANAIGSSPWGTNGTLVSRAISGASGSVPRTAAAPAAPTSSRSSTTTTTTTPGVDNSGLRRQLVANFLAQGGVKSANATGALAQGYQAAQDVPGTTTTKTTRTGVSQASLSTQGSGTGRYQARADQVDANRLPYAWGGGHAGKTDPADAVPVDCSGAVSEVLGIDPRVSGEFTKWGKPGDGGSKGITIAANSHHVLMRIDGHWFGTSASNPGGGAGWIPQALISPAYLRGFTLRHL